MRDSLLTTRPVFGDQLRCSNIVVPLPEAGTHRTPLHNSWNANCDAIVRDVHYYDGVGADEDIVTNSNWSKSRVQLARPSLAMML